MKQHPHAQRAQVGDLRVLPCEGAPGRDKPVPYGAVPCGVYQIGDE